MTDVLPRFQLGYVSPLRIVDALHYEFYQAMPRDVVMISAPVPLRDFTEEAVDHALGKMNETFRYLAQRKAGRIVIGGMPPSALAGRRRMLDMMAAASDELGVPVTSDVEDVLACLRRFDIGDVVIAAKWKGHVMSAVERYFGDAGVAVAGIQGADFGTAEIAEVVTTESMALACDLGEAALNAYPGASALVLGGGTWLSIPATARLEKAHGRPVFSNMTAMFVETARYFGVSADGISDLRLASVKEQCDALGSQPAHTSMDSTR